jgi:hypothetical protein
MGLEIDRKEYYNLLRTRDTTKLTDQQEARVIITYLNDQGCHVFVDEQYILDHLGNKEDRVILSIIWFTPEQLRLCRRFVTGFLLETDATFNKEARGLLLHNLVGIDNCGKTFPALQLFATNEGARVFEKVEEVWDRAIFYDCPSPAVLAGDFAAGLAKSVGRSAAKKKEAARKAEEISAAKGKGKAVDGDGVDETDQVSGMVAAHPDVQPYEPDSQTKAVDCITDVEDSIELSTGEYMILLYRDVRSMRLMRLRRD